MLLITSITILWGKVATRLAFLSGRNLGMNCVQKDHPRDRRLDRTCKELVLRAWGTLDSEGKCIYNIRHKEDPLPIEKMRKAVKALGDKEHDGRTRGTIGSKPWSTGFPEERKKYPDRSRQRRKDKAEVEADSQKERMRLIEERLKQQQDEINALKEKSTIGPSQQHTAFDATGLSNNRKSSVSSTEVPGDDNGDDDDAPTMAPVGYPVDDITEMTHC